MYATTAPQPHWVRCYFHLSFATESRVVRTVCHTYAMPREHRRPAGHWTRRVRQSPHVIRLTRYPTFAPIVRQPAGRPMMLWTTGYSWGCGASGAMANGQMPYVGAIASNILPMGARVTIPSLGFTGVVADRGAPLDVFVAACGLAYSVTGYRLVYVS